MAEHTDTVRIEPAEEGGYDVFVPALPGCVIQGETFEEVVAMAEEAIEGYLETLAKVGKPIPVEPQPTGSLTTAVVSTRGPQCELTAQRQAAGVGVG